MKDKRVIFMGTPEFSVPVLEMLIEKTNVIMVVSQPDSRVGRHQELRYTPVKECALKHGIEVYQPEKIRNEYQYILDANPDVIITCAYGQIIPSILLDTPKYKAINVKTLVFPGFPTDLQQPFMVLSTQCNGKSIIEETIWENRFMHVPYLNKMGANIEVTGTKAIIKGPTELIGTIVEATDLRAGASMVAAALLANGTTTIHNIEHILRGYENIVEKLNDVGAKIEVKEI